MNNGDIDKILISNKIFSSVKNYKYFIGHGDEYKIKPFTIILRKMNTYVKSYDGGATKWMRFLIEYEELLGKYDDVWNKVSNSMKKEFDSEPTFNEWFLNTKITSYGDVTRDFYDKEIPKVGCNYTCLWVILVNFVFLKEKNYYPQVFLEKCKYIEKVLLDILLKT